MLDVRAQIQHLLKDTLSGPYWNKTFSHRDIQCLW